MRNMISLVAAVALVGTIPFAIAEDTTAATPRITHVSADQLPTIYAFDEIREGQVYRRVQVLPDNGGLRIFTRIPERSKFSVETIPGKVRYLQIPKSPEFNTGEQFVRAGTVNADAVSKKDFQGLALVGDRLLTWTDTWAEQHLVPDLDNYDDNTEIHLEHLFAQGAPNALVLTSPTGGKNNGSFAKVIAFSVDGGKPNIFDWEVGGGPYANTGAWYSFYDDRINVKFGGGSNSTSVDGVHLEPASLHLLRRQHVRRDGDVLPLYVRNVPNDRDFLVGKFDDDGRMLFRIEILPENKGLRIYEGGRNHSPPSTQNFMWTIPGRVARFEWKDRRDYVVGSQMDEARDSGVISNASGAFRGGPAVLVGSEIFDWTDPDYRFDAPELGQMGPKTQILVGDTNLRTYSSNNPSTAWYFQDPDTGSERTLIFPEKADPIIYDGHVDFTEIAYLRGQEGKAYGKDTSTPTGPTGRYLDLVTDRKLNVVGQVVTFSTEKPLELDGSRGATIKPDTSLSASSKNQDFELLPLAPTQAKTETEILIDKVKAEINGLLAEVTGDDRPKTDLEMKVQKARFDEKVRHLNELQKLHNEKCSSLLSEGDAR